MENGAQAHYPEKLLARRGVQLSVVELKDWWLRLVCS